MGRIRACFGMLVAINALERRIDRLLQMAIVARVPDTGVMRSAIADREKIVVREERCGLPCQCAMACRALGGESCLLVVRVGCCQVRRAMARHTFHGRPPKTTVGVAGDARHRLVNAPRGEVCFVMIKGDEPRGLIGGMTQGAIRREPGKPVIDGRRSIEICSVTGDALPRGSFKSQGAMALDTRGTPVSATEREGRGIVVESRGDCDLLPRSSGMAFCAPHGQRTMRRFLREDHKRPKGEDDKGLEHGRST